MSRDENIILLMIYCLCNIQLHIVAKYFSYGRFIVSAVSCIRAKGRLKPALGGAVSDDLFVCIADSALTGKVFRS